MRRPPSKIRFAAALGLSLAAALGAAAQVSLETDSQNLSPLVVDSLAPLLSSWIVASRDAAKAQGVEPIPAPIRAALAGYVPETLLDRVRWREGGSQFSFPQSVLQFGDVPAVTLDDVIVFRSRRTALEDPKLWAHELWHVMQFAEWGIEGFAERYLTNYEAVEHDAAEFRWEFMKRAGLVPKVDASE